MTNEPTTNAKCWCCNGTVFKSSNDGIASHYICQSCNSLNVIGGGGGAGEPTTGEIVRALGNPETLDQESLYYWSKVAADRLESQEEEKKISRHLIEMQSNVITELTARAEQAEKNLHDAIFGTNHACFYCTMEDCDGCTNSTIKEHFKYRALKPNKYLTIQDERGLPQEGEGV